jgi:hypothetical protein
MSDEEVNEAIKDKIYLLATRVSDDESKIFCVGIIRLGTPNTEFVMGDLNNDKDYQVGEEVKYIHNANYTSILYYALKWLDRVK